MHLKIRNRIADSGTEIADSRHPDAAAIDDLSELPDLVFGEILRTLSGDSHVVTVLVVVFVGEAVEFGLVHGAIGVSRRESFGTVNVKPRIIVGARTTTIGLNL